MIENEETLQAILNEFRDKKNNLEFLKESVINFIKFLLEKRPEIKIHSIESRIKDITSLRNKLINKDTIYRNIEDITDLVGIRIITFFDDHIDELEKIILDNFENTKDSVDKRKNVSIGEFGYASDHLVVKLSDERKCLPEYSEVKNLCFEIQIRTILQHSWADIYHDMGYKEGKSVSEKEKRNFHSIAGIFDLVDREFVRFRKEVEVVRKKASDEIENNKKSEIPLSYITYQTFIKSEKYQLFNENLISELIKHGYDAQFDKYTILDEDRLRIIGIENIGDLNEIFEKNKDEAIKLMPYWLKEHEVINVSKTKELKKIYGTEDMGMFYICIAEIIKKPNNENLIERYFFDRNIENKKEIIKKYLNRQKN